MSERISSPPKQRPGTVSVRWAKTRFDAPDWFVSWGGPADSSDARTCVAAIASLGDELARRGFDITTLRFEVKKKPTEKEGA